MKRLAWLPLLATFACAKSTQIPTTFSTQWLNDSGHSIAAVEQRISKLPAPPNVDLAVGITEGAIIGIPLKGGQKWSHAALPDTLPSVAGGLVLYSSRGQLTALDGKTGAQRWSTSVGGYWLRGAGDDGQTTVVTLGTSDRKKSLLLMVRHDGSVRTKLETDFALGHPAARGGVALVPWSDQYVSAIDMESGDEEGRLLTREIVSQAITVAGEIFVGEKAMIRFDDKVRYASTQQGDRVMLPSRVLPGKPSWLGSGASLPVIDPSARAKIRIYAAPTFENGRSHFASDQFVATYFRTIMGFDARKAELAWVRALPSAVIGGAAAASGFVLCSSDGKLSYFDPKGGVSAGPDLGAALRGCVVAASTFQAPAAAAPGTLASQLGQALASLDPEMAAAQAFLVGELGRVDDPSVTKTLIDLTSNARVPPDVRLRARELLAQRRSGPEAMLAALERHYDFLAGDLLPPPVGPLADALSAMGEQRAAPLLAKHLNDPSTDVGDLERAARALATLATSNEIASLRTFFALYRATADEPQLVASVAWVARALLRVGGPDARLSIDKASRDPMTQPEVARELTQLMASSQEKPEKPAVRDPKLGSPPIK